MSEHEEFSQPEIEEQVFIGRSTGAEFTIWDFEGMHFNDTKKFFEDFSDEDLRELAIMAEKERDEVERQAYKLKDKSRNWHQIAYSAYEVVAERERLEKQERNFKEQQSRPQKPEPAKWKKLKGVLGLEEAK